MKKLIDNGAIKMGFFSKWNSEINQKRNGRIDSKTAQTLSGSVMIPDSMDVIEEKLFDGNKRITSVTVPGTVKRIGIRAFANCDNLERVSLCEGIEAIESNAFTGCKKLRRVTYPDSIKTYRGWTFYNTNLEAPVMNVSKTLLVFCPESVSGREWSVPDTVKIISQQAFVEHKELEVLHLPEGLEKIEGKAVVECGIKEIVIPFSVREIGKEAFWRCEQLEKVTVLNPETKVARSAFGDCINLKDIICDSCDRPDKKFHLKGLPFLLQHMEDPANLNHGSDLTFSRLKHQCAKGDGDAMNELAEWFEEMSHNPKASAFYVRAANYWRYRAYCKGNANAAQWFDKFFAENPDTQLQSILCESNDHDANWYSFSIPGKMLNDLGFDFFEPDKEYEIKKTENEDILEVGSYESFEGPDEDGFGAEVYYDWWFLDENMQPIPGVNKVNASMRDRRISRAYAYERAKAKEILNKRKNGKGSE